MLNKKMKKNSFGHKSQYEFLKIFENVENYNVKPVQKKCAELPKKISLFYFFGIRPGVLLFFW